MKYTKETLDKNRVKFTYEADCADWQAAIEKAYNKVKGRFNIPGFRKGHAPKKKIEALYGTSVFFEDALDEILPDYYSKTLEEEKDLEPVARPDISIVAISDASLKFTALVQLSPDVTLGKYTGLEIKAVDAKVSKTEVDEEIKKAQERAGSWTPVTDRPATDGDKTVIDFSGSVGGVKFDGGTAEKHELILGSNSFIPGFETQVVGMKIGDTKDVKVTFPADYGEKSLAGKEAVFAVKLHELKAKQLPELNDEFAKDVSEFDTLKDYTESVKKKLVDKKQKDADVKMENALIEEIVKGVTVEIPSVMVEARAEDMVREFEYRITYQGMKPEQYYQYAGTTPDAMKAQYMGQAKKNVEIDLVLHEIIKKENLQVSDAELDEKLTDFTKDGQDVSDGHRDYIKNQLLTEKLVEFLKKNNKFV